jgi:uncharacterized protein (TIGR01777 family)
MLGKVIITGGSGFLGSEIAARLKARGISPVILDLFPPKDSSLEFVKVNLSENIPEDEKLKNPYAIIHLAGAPIFGKWTEEKKKIIYDSRILGTKNLVKLFEKEEFKPKVFVSASAVGFYGDRDEEEININTGKGEGFLSDVCRDWEIEAFCAEKLDIKTTVIRNGLILGKSGLIKVLKPYYEWGIGGPIGKGEQWFPWVHVNDCAEIYIKTILGKIDAKIINAVAPEQVRNKDFSKIFAKVLKRPHFLFIPIFALRFLYGGFANEITASQKIKTEIQGFKFEFDKVENALSNIL